MSARNDILSRIRSRIPGQTSDADRSQAVAERLASHRPGLIPARGQRESQNAKVDLFADMLRKSSASVERIEHLSEAPQRVLAYLKAHNLPCEIRMGDDPRLAAANFPQESLLTLRKGASDGQDLAAVSHALGGIAETGTLGLLSGPDNPVTLNFLPDHHIILVRAEDVSGDMEGLFAMLRAAMPNAMPRTVNLISGPSRSADIEQTIILGAHGPRALHVIIY